MGEVFAGFLVGYVLTVISTPLLAIALLRLRASSVMVGRLLPGANILSLSVILHGTLFFFWTGIGIILGLLLLAMDGGGRALGSANAGFTLFVAGLTLAIMAPFIVILRPLRRVLIGLSLVMLVAFGWLMPWLAEWSSF